MIYMTVHGIQQHEQSSVERQLHLPGWGLTMEPADEEIVEAGIFKAEKDMFCYRTRARRGCANVDRDWRFEVVRKVADGYAS